MRRVYGPWFFKFLVGALLLSLLWKLVRRDGTRLLITAIGSVLTALLFVLTLPEGGPASLNHNAGWWWIRFAAMTLLWLTANAHAVSRRLVLGPLVSFMAVGAAAGSGNGVVHEVVLTVGIFGVGILVHGLVVVSPTDEAPEHMEPGRRCSRAAVLLPIALFFGVGSLASSRALQGALRSPYRLIGGLNAETESVDLGVFGTIDVHPETTRYIRQLQAIGKRMPTEARDCLVDLAGGTPLSALALGAQPAASPWIVGGYSGSNDFADYVLADSRCLSGPYILIEAPRGTRAIDRPAWLDTTGATFLGRPRYSGYMTDDQLIWLVPGT